MKNDGVPLTPLRTPPRKSACIFAANRRCASASRSPRSESPKALPKAKNQGQAELVLICIKPIVHFPEEVMRSCVFGGLRRRLREWVRLGQWEVPENEPELLAEPLLRQLDVREGKAAVRTLVVAIFDHCDWRVVGTFDVVGGCDGYSQKTHDVTAAGMSFFME